ncbi:MAG: terpene cyclase/mutase family protein [Phycisphaerales bacterium]|nr:MAG: terpene cyclase/mutase family protein [Phycisphaerales bacterium]
MNAGVHDWLLQGEPWVRYRTLTDLLHKRRSDRQVVEARNAVQKHPLISGLFGRRNTEGYWGTPKDIHTWWPRKDTTFWVLGVLADFGFSKDDESISRACEYVFGIQLDSGGFGWDPPTQAYECHTAILTETLAKLGYADDRRLIRAYDWLAIRHRQDGGFWCKNTGQPDGPRRREPSCAFATLLVLGALAHNKALHGSHTVKTAIAFLLDCWDKRGKVKYAGHDSQISTGFGKLKYPFTDYRILKYLTVLSEFESVRQDHRVQEMLQLGVSKCDRDGRFAPEAVHRAWSEFDFGRKKAPSRWITFLVLRILARLSPQPIAQGPS